ncbi:MAG: sialidase family protein [Acidimicrobiales bacterium]
MTSVTRRRAGPLVAAGLVAALLAGNASVAGARDPARVTQAVPATLGDVNPTKVYASPVVAVDPENPRTMVAVAAEIRSRTCGLLRSNDAGQTWVRPEGSPAATRFPFCFQTETGPRQADLAFGRDGTLYYTYAGWDVADTASDWPIGTGGGWRGNVSVVLSRSNDLGESWETTVVKDATGFTGDQQENNRPVSSIAVDAQHGPDDIVYIGWKVTYRDRQGLRLAVSTDGGRTFGAPADLTAGYFDDNTNRGRLAQGAGMAETPHQNRIMYYWPDMTLDDDGTLYAVWNARFGPGPQMDDTAVLVSRSEDRGRTFTVTEVSPAPKTYRYPMLEWTEHGGKDGTLHMVYEGATPQKIDWLFDVYHVKSTDRGQTWSTPMRLSDDPPEALAGKYHPDLAIAPDGRVDVAWWDFRHDNGNFATDVYLTSSPDNGATWSPNLRVTDRSVNRRIGVWYGNSDIRQPPGIVATDQFTVVGWDDTRNGDETTQTQDIYTSMVQYELLGSGTSSAARYALGVAAGLAVLGLALLLVALFQPGRRTGPKLPKETRESQPA